MTLSINTIFLKIYFLVLVGIVGYDFFYAVQDLETIKILNFIILTIFLIGIYGFCFEKKIFKPIFWQIFLILIIPWNFFELFYEIDIMSINDSKFLLLFIFIALWFFILLPGYIAVYLYGHQNSNDADKNRTKILLGTIAVVIITNVTTFILSHRHAERGAMVLQAMDSLMSLDQLLKNNTERAKFFNFISVNSFFYVVGESDDVEKYKRMCIYFNKNIFKAIDENDKKFDLTNKQLKINNTKDEDIIEFNKQAEKGRIIIRNGKEKIRELCQKE